tara:strand:- start:7932 stop:8312 length:381 start_codon:yes stop_codon:yes gene_type:complete
MDRKYLERHHWMTLEAPLDMEQITDTDEVSTFIAGCFVKGHPRVAVVSHLYLDNSLTKEGASRLAKDLASSLVDKRFFDTVYYPGAEIVVTRTLVRNIRYAHAAVERIEKSLLEIKGQLFPEFAIH